MDTEPREHMPVFIKINKPMELNELIVFLRNKNDETRVTLNKIKSLSKEESSKISEWKSNFESLNEQLKKITTNLLEPERI